MDPDTLPKLLLNNFHKYGNRKIAMRRKDLGIWNCYSWEDYYSHVKYLCLGLVSLGMQRGDRVALLGDNAPELYWAQLAAQSNGGIATGIYSDSSAQEIQYYLQHIEATFLFVQDQEQVDKTLMVVEELPLLRKVIFWDPRGLLQYSDPILESFENVLERGKEYAKKNNGLFEELVAQGKKDDLAIVFFTSGTTGLPKGAMHTHRSLIFIDKAWFQIDNWHDDFDYVSMSPPAWMAEEVCGVVAQLLVGMRVNFPEEPETLEENIREVAPHVMLFGARQLESIISQIELKMLDTHPIKRNLYNFAIFIGRNVCQKYLSNENVNLHWKILYFLADVMILRAIRGHFGFLRAKWCYVGGTLINPELIKFFLAIGVNMKTMYGLSEGGISCIPKDGNVKIHTSGPVVPGYEIKISDEGEILIKSEGTFKGYWNNSQATEKTVKEGWVQTGDAGFLDEDGHLIVIDRVGELIDLPGDEKFSPQYIETVLRFSTFVKDVIAIGGKDRPYMVCLINIDFDGVGKWAENNHIIFTTFPDLSQKPQVYDLIYELVKRGNSILPDYAKIKKFCLLHKEFDSDEGELTRSRKLRRSVVEKNYKFIIDAIYKGLEEVVAEAVVKYRDGRTGKVTTNVKIRTMD